MNTLEDPFQPPANVSKSLNIDAVLDDKIDEIIKEYRIEFSPDYGELIAAPGNEHFKNDEDWHWQGVAEAQLHAMVELLGYMKVNDMIREGPKGRDERPGDGGISDGRNTQGDAEPQGVGKGAASFRVKVQFKGARKRVVGVDVDVFDAQILNKKKVDSSSG